MSVKFEAIRQKRMDLLIKNSWILHHNNAPSYQTIILHEFVVKHIKKTIPEPTNSPDLAPCDFFILIPIENTNL